VRLPRWRSRSAVLTRLWMGSSRDEALSNNALQLTSGEARMEPLAAERSVRRT
jgi:hypothetical protein